MQVKVVAGGWWWVWPGWLAYACERETYKLERDLGEIDQGYAGSICKS